MRVLMSVFGSGGDLNPFLAIAKELGKRGHACRMLVNPQSVDFVRRSGVDGIGVGNPYNPASWKNDAKGWKRSTALLREVIIPNAEPMYHALHEQCALFKPSILFGHHTSFSSPWIARRHGIPFATGYVAPSSWISASDPNRYPGMPDLDRYPSLMIRIGNRAGRMMTNRAVDPVINRIRINLGLETGSDFLFEDTLSGSANIGMWSPSFRGPSHDDPSNAHIVGFPVLQGGTLSETTQQFLDDDAAPIVITLGTTAVHTEQAWMKRLSDSFLMQGCRVLLLAGSEEASKAFTIDSPRFLAVPGEPHGALFPKCAGVVHHGGIGTTAQALRSGIPAILTPFAADQFDNARRCRLLGAATTLDPHKSSNRMISGAITKMLSHESRASAKELGRTMAHEDAADHAVRALERAA
ncbi:MAG: glycosyltransferase [Planctomycetota bacterium]